MKKIAALLLIMAMLITVSACKRVDTEDDAVVIAGGEGDKAESVPEEQEKETESEAFAPAQKQEQDSTQETLEQDENKEEKPLQEEPDYLPLKEGYVTKQTTADGTVYRAQSDFIIKEPITEQMVKAAVKYQYGENESLDPDNRYLTNRIPYDNAGFPIHSREDFDSILAYVEELTKNDYVVKGHFEQSYGTSYTYNEVDRVPEGSRCNYKTTGYTIFNFVIETVYSENCEYKAGDVIEIALPGTVYQGADGIYRATAARGEYAYHHFKNATLEERTFILSVTPKNEQSMYRDIIRVSNIQQNVYEQIPEIDNDYCNLSREILAKYK